MQGRKHREARPGSTEEYDWLSEFPPEASGTSTEAVPAEQPVLALPSRPPASPPSGTSLLGPPISSPRLPPAHTPKPPPLLTVLRAKLPSRQPARTAAAWVASASLILIALIGPDALMRQAPQTPQASPEAQARARAQAALARPVYPPPEFSPAVTPVSTRVLTPVAPVSTKTQPPARPSPAQVVAPPPAIAPAPSARPSAAGPKTEPRGPVTSSATPPIKSDQPSTSTPPVAPVALRGSLSRPAAPLDRLLGPPIGQPISAPPPVAAAATTTSGSARTAPTADADQARTAQTASVRAVLDRYRWAFTNLDASAVEPFWPGVDGRALERAFDQLQSQVIKFDHCEINLAGARAVASCQGQASTVRKMGSRGLRIEPRQWTFALNRVNDAWLIQNVSTRSGR
jgi:hypothetical protein